MSVPCYNYSILNLAKEGQMKIQLYDRVFMKDGHEASIVEIFDDGMAFLADIDKNNDTYTEEIKSEEIDKVL